jgi:hypothetical protein
LRAQRSNLDQKEAPPREIAASPRVKPAGSSQ